MKISKVNHFATICLLGIAWSSLGATNTIAQVTSSFSEPWEHVEVAAGESGILAEVNVREGQVVKAGEILARLDTRILLQTRRLAERRASSTARIEAARIDVEIKQMLFDNLSPLLKEGHANPNEVELARVELEKALASLRLAEDQAAEDQIELDRIDAQIQSRGIRSPLDGIVTEIHRRPGEYLPATDPRFATVAMLEKLRCRFFVETSLAETLTKGDAVVVQLGDLNKRVNAIVEFVSPITNSSSGTVRVDVSLDNAKGNYRSGVACRLMIPVNQEFLIEQSKSAHE